MPDNNDKEVGERIRHLRHNAKLTQVGLEKVSGVDANTIARLERGLHTASMPTLKSLAKALNVKVSDILGD